MVDPQVPPSRIGFGPHQRQDREYSLMNAPKQTFFDSDAGRSGGTALRNGCNVWHEREVSHVINPTPTYPSLHSMQGRTQRFIIYPQHIVRSALQTGAVRVDVRLSERLAANHRAPDIWRLPVVRPNSVFHGAD